MLTRERSLCYRARLFYSGDLLRLRAGRLRPPGDVAVRPERPAGGASPARQRGRNGATAGRPGGHRDTPRGDATAGRHR